MTVSVLLRFLEDVFLPVHAFPSISYRDSDSSVLKSVNWKKKALNEGMTEKQLRNAKKDVGASSNKTDFDGGWNLSLSNPKHVP